MSPCRRMWVCASMRPGSSVMSPRSIVCASAGTGPPIDSMVFPRTTITAGDTTLPLRPSIIRAARRATTLSAAKAGRASRARIRRRFMSVDFIYTEEMKFSVEEYVRWEDIDAAGIINYQAYLRFFGLAEAELFRSCGLGYHNLFEELGIWLPRVHVECDFFHPVTLDELLVVEAFFGKIGRSSIHLNLEVRRKQEADKIVATGQYVLACVKRGAFTSSPVPDFGRDKLAPYVHD